MKKVWTAAIACLLVSSAAHADADDDARLLNSFHKYGITKCDDFILENSRLIANWSYSISKHANGIDGPTTEVSLIRIWGDVNDTVKTDDTYIQTPKKCFLTRRSTLTFPGTCSENIDPQYWYVSNELEGRDYTTYKNGNGVEMQAKEIKVGNFKACVQETLIRQQGPQS
jgi:hypothetical protein